MAILTRAEIKRQLELGNIVVDPAPTKIGPNSVDVHLGPKLRVYNIYGNPHTVGGAAPPHWHSESEHHDALHSRISLLDPQQENPTIELTIPPNGFVLRPGVLYLAATQEYTETRGFVPYLDGRSSTGRLGIFIHLTAGRGDVGFCGRWTCELMVVHPVRVFAGLRFGQITYHTVEGAVEEYTGRYQGDREPVASHMHLPE